MVGYKNERAATAGTPRANKDYLYNFVIRLLLERVTQFVKEHADANGLPNPAIRIVCASRRGHHFGHFKAYILGIIRQAEAGTTVLNTREIIPNTLRYDLIERIPASQSVGLQLADIITSATFQAIEQDSPGFNQDSGLAIRPIIAGKQRWSGSPILRNNVGMTLYPAPKAASDLNAQQEKFFSSYGYNFDWLRTQQAKG